MSTWLIRHYIGRNDKVSPASCNCKCLSKSRKQFTFFDSHYGYTLRVYITGLHSIIQQDLQYGWRFCALIRVSVALNLLKRIENQILKVYEQFLTDANSSGGHYRGPGKCYPPPPHCSYPHNWAKQWPFSASNECKQRILTEPIGLPPTNKAKYPPLTKKVNYLLDSKQFLQICNADLNCEPPSRIPAQASRMDFWRISRSNLMWGGTAINLSDIVAFRFRLNSCVSTSHVVSWSASHISYEMTKKLKF